MDQLRLMRLLIRQVVSTSLDAVKHDTVFLYAHRPYLPSRVHHVVFTTMTMPFLVSAHADFLPLHVS